MDADLEKAYLLITDASYAEDVFGYENVILPAETMKKFLAVKYDELQAVTNPHSYSHPDDKDVAHDIRNKLDRFYERAILRVELYLYGIPGYDQSSSTQRAKSFSIGDANFFIGHKFSEGSHTTLYKAFMEKTLDDHVEAVGDVVLKLSNSEADNQHTRNEARILRHLHKLEMPQWKHLPFVLESFQAEGRFGLVQRPSHGHTMTQVREHPTHRSGVDRKHIAWMIDRILSCFGYVHSRGVVHGNITPEHLIVQPFNHNIIVTGWGSAVLNPAVSDERVREFSSVFTPPEVRETGRIGPWSDVYSIGKVLIWLIGGDPVENQIPDEVEDPIKEFLLRMVRESYSSRPDDCFELYDEQCQIKDSLWPRKFLHFDMS